MHITLPESKFQAGCLSKVGNNCWIVNATMIVAVPTTYYPTLNNKNRGFASGKARKEKMTGMRMKERHPKVMHFSILVCILL